nr:hypothetical protein CFP56_62701 [Quercus suber]
MTSRNSMHCEKLSNVFFMVLIATFSNSQYVLMSERLHNNTHQSAFPDDVSASAPRPAQGDTSETAIADVLDDLKSVFEAEGRLCFRGGFCSLSRHEDEISAVEPSTGCRSVGHERSLDAASKTIKHSPGSRPGVEWDVKERRCRCERRKGVDDPCAESTESSSGPGSWSPGARLDGVGVGLLRVMISEMRRRWSRRPLERRSGPRARLRALSR